MFKVIATEVVISKGFEGAPALRFSENGDSVRFRIGKKVYDTRAENNHRWVNLSVKAFGPLCERIKKMQLKEGSFVNLLGRLDEDVWEDAATHERKKRYGRLFLTKLSTAPVPDSKKRGRRQQAHRKQQQHSRGRRPAHRHRRQLPHRITVAADLPGMNLLAAPMLFLTYN